MFSSAHAGAANALAAAAAAGMAAVITHVDSTLHFPPHGVAPAAQALALTLALSLTGASPPRGSKPRQGRDLPVGEHITYNVDERRPGEAPPPQLQSNPITIIKTASPPELRQLIAVNASYICYALNETRLRLLNKHTADKGPLLRDHTGGVTDLRCIVLRLRLSGC